MSRVRRPGEPLSPLLRAKLGSYFPGLDLESVRLHPGVPRYVPGRPLGYVNRHRIYLARESSDVGRRGVPGPAGSRTGARPAVPGARRLAIPLGLPAGVSGRAPCSSGA